MNLKYNLLRGLRKIGLLKLLNLILVTKVNGQPFRIPLFHGFGLSHFSPAEQWMMDLIKKLLTSNRGVFIDVGVNIGQTLLKLKSVDKTIKYMGFEPNPHCLFYLDELCRVNNFDNTLIFPVAVSNRLAIVDLEMYEDDKTDSSASIVTGMRRNSLDSMKVMAVGGEQIAALLKDTTVGIIKIDVEGGELDVLNALESVVKRDRPLIICEVLPVYKKENVSRLKRQIEIQTILQGSRYKIARILPQNKVELIDEFGIDGNIELVNYIFFPVERSQELSQFLAVITDAK